MKKLTLIAALICGASLSSFAANQPQAQQAVAENAAVATPSPEQLEAAFVLRDYYEYAYTSDEMCGHSGNAAANSVDDLVDLLNMLHDFYCG